MSEQEYLKRALSKALKSKGCASKGELEITLERPKNPEHGDFATNVAMLLASKLKRNPREIAAELLEELDLDSKVVSKAEIAGAGFINFYLEIKYLGESLNSVIKGRDKFGCSDWGARKKVQIEFVSANPTGPLNVVSARAATVGDVLVNLFNAVGFDAKREYYVNDAGRQIRLLGKSVSARYMELLGQEEPFPEEGYHGEYIRDIAKEIHAEHGDKFGSKVQNQRWQDFSELALEKILIKQKKTLSDYRVDFDIWFREGDLRTKNVHLKVLETLSENGHVYERDGAKWFKSSDFGDEKDRVLVTREGEPTYFLVDISYHVHKYQRGFEKLYDLWGPDHHGYIPRMKAALVALGYPEGSFEVNIIQQVNLLEKGEVVKMSKRAGKIIEMKGLIEEVGVDVARFFFVARRSQSPLDFDMDLAKNSSEENPVFYVQYAHARICNIIKHAEEQGFQLPDHANLNLLEQEEEVALIKKLLEFPDIISKAAKFLEPHRIPNYLQDLATIFKLPCLEIKRSTFTSWAPFTSNDILSLLFKAGGSKSADLSLKLIDSRNVFALEGVFFSEFPNNPESSDG